MIKLLRKKFALSEKGARDMIKAFVANTVYDIVLMFPEFEYHLRGRNEKRSSEFRFYRSFFDCVYLFIKSRKIFALGVV